MASQMREKIWHYLAAQSEPKTSLEVAQAIGTTQGIVSSNLTALTRMNQAEFEKHKLYNNDAIAYSANKYRAIGTKYVHRVYTPPTVAKSNKERSVARKEAALVTPTTVAMLVPKPAPADVPKDSAYREYQEFLEYKAFMEFKKMKRTLTS